MKLGALVAALRRAGQLVGAPAADLELATVTEDSRRVTAGALFCAVAGSATDGHRYLGDAVRRGAAAVMVTRPANVGVPEVVVRDSRAALGVVAAEWFGRPSDGLTVIGVTGTSGKSTTVALIRHLLNEQGDAGAIGTVGALDGQGVELPEGAGLTTPSALELQATLAEFRRRGVKSLALEASSHALDQRRLEGIGFQAGVYTNLSHDHLDYHGDLSAYLEAKLRLSSLLVDGGVEVVNLDERAWRGLPPAGRLRRLTYGVQSDAEIRGSEARCDARGSAFRVTFGRETVPVTLPLLGEFNVSNALAAGATAFGLGRRPRAIADRLAQAPQVPGRMEQIVAEPFAILRDYSHKPDALDRAIRALRPLTRGRLIVLFGAGGDRDKQKRPIMGQIVARGADVAIVTSDNPRTEDPDRIIDEIEAGMEGTAHIRLVDRREAIHRALTLAGPGDCVLLAGKGHETYQVIGTEKLPFDEREIVLAALGRMRAA